MSPKAMLAGAAAAVFAALVIWALLERGWRLEAEARAIVLAAQGQVVADAVKRCSAGAEEVKRVGELATTGLAAALEKIRAAAAPKWRTVERIEKIVEVPAPAGAGCDQAWDIIEADVKKAGAAP